MSIKLRDDISLFLRRYESSAIKGATVALTSQFYFIVLDDYKTCVGVALVLDFTNMLNNQMCVIITSFFSHICDISASTLEG